MKRSHLLPSLALLALSACGGEPARYTELIAEPDRLTLLGPDHARILHVKGRLPSGELEPTADVRIASSDEAIVRVSDFRARAVAPGSASITLEAGGRATTITVDVLDLPAPYAQELLAEERGLGDGFGRSALPEIVLGPPRGGGLYQGGTDTLSLGLGGSITVGFGPLRIYDGPGVDLIVFENPFRIAGGSDVYAEPGIVEASLGGTDWSAFSCDAAAPRHPGCAGVNPVIAGPGAPEVDPTDPPTAGGDAYDLSDLPQAGALAEADRLRITDARTGTITANSSGFDLDAVAIVHALPADAVALEASFATMILYHGQDPVFPRFDLVRADGSRVYGVPATLTIEPYQPFRTEAPLIETLPSGHGVLTARLGSLSTTVNIEVAP